MGYATALTEWGDLGGYDLEAQWAAAARRSVKTPIEDFTTRLVSELSGGERKRLVLDLLLNAGADVLLLDEPDNYLDIPTRLWLEEQLARLQIDHSHGQPRPHPARSGGHQDRGHRGFRLLGARRLLPGPSPRPGPAARNCSATPRNDGTTRNDVCSTT